MRQTKKKTSRLAAIKLAKQYIELCGRMNLHISKAILFGSQATGTAHNDSDIDLLLVSNKFKNNTLENWKMLAPVTARLYNVEPHPYPEKKFREGDPLIEQIKHTGIEIRIS